MNRKSTATAVLAAVAIAVVPSVAFAGPPGGWGPVIECESGGNPDAQNPRSTASGLFQFINGTWRAYGGGEFARTAAGATAQEQTIVAERAYAAQGLRPWAASRSCWNGAVRPSQAPGTGYAVRAGDTMSGIAAELLGDPGRWPEIAAVNPAVDPDVIFVGQTLVMPR